MNKFFVFACFIFLAAHAHSSDGEHHTCIHDTLTGVSADNRAKYNNIDFESLKRSSLANRFSVPLKILVNYDNLQNDRQTCYKQGQVVTISRVSYKCTADDVLTPEKSDYLKQLIEEGSSLWTLSLSVLPQESMNILDGCPGFFSASLQPPPDSYASITDANFVLYATVRPIPNSSALAFAVTCLTDSINRPIAGYANFAPSKLQPGNPLLYREQVSVVSHELAHALGFSFTTGMSKWVSWDTPTGVPRQMERSEVVGYNATLNMSYIISPTVVKTAQDHFNCDETNIAFLEKLGGSATFGSHWSMKQYYDDIMTGVTTAFRVNSPMTFAYFKDSGWYGIYNESAIESLIWGRGRGCSFVYDCSSWPMSTASDPGYKCRTPAGGAVAQPQCTFDLKSQGACSDTKKTVNPLMDNECTYIYTPEDSRCDNPFNSFLFHAGVGEWTGKTSRCFRSNILKMTRQFTIDTPPGVHLTQCYNTTCQSRTQLKVGVNGIWYDCPYEGGEVSVVGFGGSIVCIPQAADRICLDAKNDTEEWPIIEEIVPGTAYPETLITVTGQNFLRTNQMQVFLVKGVKNVCSNVNVINDTALTCTLADASAFATLTDIAQSLSGPVPLNVYVSDALGRTDLKMYAVSVFVVPENAIKLFLKTYPHWIAIFGVLLLVIIVVIAVLISKAVGWNPLEDKYVRT